MSPTTKAIVKSAVTTGAWAIGGAVAGEMLRHKLLQPGKDGQPSWLAKTEAEHAGAVGALVTALPGLAAGTAMYAVARRTKNPTLAKAGYSTVLGATVMGGARLVFGTEAIRQRTSTQIVDAPAAPALPSGPTAGYGAHPPAYHTLQGHPPAYQTLQDTYVNAPYGDSYVEAPPAPSYRERVAQQRNLSRSAPLSAVDELYE